MIDANHASNSDPNRSNFDAADQWATAEHDGSLDGPNSWFLCDEAARCEAADLRFLHVLLQQIGDPGEAARERRILCLMNALDDGIAQPLPSDEKALPWSAKSLTARAPWFSVGRRWVVSGLTLAAGLLVMAVIWAGHNGTEVSAYAAVEQVYSAATSLQDREYSVVSEIKRASDVIEVESTLFVRGGEKYSIRHPFVLGEIWIGYDGHQSWLVPPLGAAITREESHDSPHYLREWANDSGFVIPELQLTALIAHLRDQFELELLPSEPLATSPEALAAAAGEPLDLEQLARTEVMWRRIRGTLSVPLPGRPAVVDVWCHPETGVARRIDLVWHRDKSPGSSRGLRRMTVQLVRDHVLDESWYEPTGHPWKRAASPKTAE